MAVNMDTMFNPRLNDQTRELGDAYDPEGRASAQAEWAIDRYVLFHIRSRDQAHDTIKISAFVGATRKNSSIDPFLSRDRPYLNHVKSLSFTWPHLRVLADFMEIGTAPNRWPKLRSQRTAEVRQERSTRTTVARLVFENESTIFTTLFRTAEELSSGVNGSIEGQPKLALYVCEDLSRDVIEILGSAFDIEPEFFRSQILDYAWYNTKHAWRDPPALALDASKRRWFTLRYAAVQYFKSHSSFRRAQAEVDNWNVLRRLDDDQNNLGPWGDEGAVTAVMTHRASFWLNCSGPGVTPIGVILLDPSPRDGFPLWEGYRNREHTPGMHQITRLPLGPPRNSLFSDFIFWAQKSQLSTEQGHHAQTNISSSSGSLCYQPVQTLLYLICTQWLDVVDYIGTRISELDWEIFHSDYFGQERQIRPTFNKLQTWQRLGPLYRKMVVEAIEQVFNNTNFTGNKTESAAPSNPSTAISGVRQPLEDRQVTIDVIAYRAEFDRILAELEQHISRIQQLVAIAPTLLTMTDTIQGLEENHAVARLTLLAFFFIPMSFVASLFSMQTDLSQSGQTFKWYFATALPFTLIFFLYAFGMTKTGRLLGKMIGQRVKNPFQ